ncbi:MAG: hypothetical protein DI585_02090 [Pseudomonas fluorescens]|nr:MAG: hypothetical protein DI585_02090 [Pseudomonas fluorescens]
MWALRFDIKALLLKDSESLRRQVSMTCISSGVVAHSFSRVSASSSWSALHLRGAVGLQVQVLDAGLLDFLLGAFRIEENADQVGAAALDGQRCGGISGGGWSGHGGYLRSSDSGLDIVTKKAAVKRLF